jgi:hypothetical protein
MKGPLREILPIGSQRVRLRLPNGMLARKIHLLTADAAPAVERTPDGVLTITVPTIEVHEVVAIDV